MENKPKKSYPVHQLFEIERDVECLKCGNKGAVTAYGEYHVHGVGPLADTIKSYESHRNIPYLSPMFGFGGTIPHECLNCGNKGLIGFGGLEGYEMAFKRIEK